MENNLFNPQKHKDPTLNTSESDSEYNSLCVFIGKVWFLFYFLFLGDILINDMFIELENGP